MAKKQKTEKKFELSVHEKAEIAALSPEEKLARLAEIEKRLKEEKSLKKAANENYRDTVGDLEAQKEEILNPSGE